MVIGGAILALAIAALVVVLWRRHDDRPALLVAITVMAIAFFVLPTRVHERYLYPFFALGAILLALRPRWAAVYAVLAAANFANLYGILTLPFYDNPGLGPMLGAFGGLGARLGEAFRSQAGVTLAAIAHAGGLLAAAVFLVRPMPGETDRVPGSGWAGVPVDEQAAGALDGGPGDAGPPSAASGATAVAARQAIGSSAIGPTRRRAITHRANRRRASTRRRRLAERAVRPLAIARARGRRPLRPPRPVVHPRARRRRAVPPHVPPGRAAPDALRRGLPRPDGHRVPAVLEVRRAARDLRVHPPPPRQVRDRGRDRALRATTRSSRRATSGRRSAMSRSSRAGTTPPLPPRTRMPPRAAAQRLYVASGDALDVYDLQHPRPAGHASRCPGRSAVAVATGAHQVFVGTAAGEILVMDTAVSADTAALGLRGRPRRPRAGPVRPSRGGTSGAPGRAALGRRQRRRRHGGAAGRRPRHAATRRPRRRAVADRPSPAAPRWSTRATVDALVADSRARSRDAAAAAAELAKVIGGERRDLRAAAGEGRARRSSSPAELQADRAAARHGDRRRQARRHLGPDRPAGGGGGERPGSPSSSRRRGRRRASCPSTHPRPASCRSRASTPPTLYVATGSSLAVDQDPSRGRRGLGRPDRLDARPRSSASRSTPRASSSTSWAGRPTARDPRSTWSSRGATRSSPTPRCRSPRRRGRSTSRPPTRAPTGSSCSSSPPTEPAPPSTSARTRSPGESPGMLAGALMAGFAVPAGPDPLPAPLRGRPGRPLHAGRRDALRAVPDRDERHLRGPLHRRRA